MSLAIPDPASAPPPKRLAYTPAEAAALLGITRKTIYKLMERGELRTTKIGSCRRVPADEVRRLAGLDGGAE